MIYESSKEFIDVLAYICKIIFYPKGLTSGPKKTPQSEWQDTDNKSLNCRKMNNKDQVPHCTLQYQAFGMVVQQTTEFFGLHSSSPK